MCTSVNESMERHDRATAIDFRQAFDAEERKVILGWCLVQIALFAIFFLLAGCSIGPRYVRPPVQSPLAYKELPQPVANESETWQTAKPSDGAARDKWWKGFNDPKLNELEEKA